MGSRSLERWERYCDVSMDVCLCVQYTGSLFGTSGGSNLRRLSVHILYVWDGALVVRS